MLHLGLTHCWIARGGRHTGHGTIFPCIYKYTYAPLPNGPAFMARRFGGCLDVTGEERDRWDSAGNWLPLGICFSWT